MPSLKRRRVSVVGSALALVAALSIVSTTLATFPGRNGPITFMRQDANGHWQTWIARSDLSHARQLTSIPDRDSGWSAWSPDGKRIAFDSNRADPDPDADPYINDIFTMKADGTDVRKLTDSVGYAGGAPAYSPDGRLVAFEADRGDYPAQAGIYVMNARDGSHRRRITTLPPDRYWDGAPRFSPDGKKLLFTRSRNDWSESAIHVVRLDGSGLRRITPWDLNAGDGTGRPMGSRSCSRPTRRLSARERLDRGSDGDGLENLTPTPTLDGRPRRLLGPRLLAGRKADPAAPRALLRGRLVHRRARDDASATDHTSSTSPTGSASSTSRTGAGPRATSGEFARRLMASESLPGLEAARTSAGERRTAPPRPAFACVGSTLPYRAPAGTRGHERSAA